MADTKLVMCEKCLGNGHVSGGNENSAWSKTCEACHGIGFIRVPMTNADRIRAMSDEELATDLLDMFQEICEDGVPSKEWMIDWLKKSCGIKSYKKYKNVLTNKRGCGNIYSQGANT